MNRPAAMQVTYSMVEAGFKPVQGCKETATEFPGMWDPAGTRLPSTPTNPGPSVLQNARGQRSKYCRGGWVGPGGELGWVRTGVWGWSGVKKSLRSSQGHPETYRLQVPRWRPQGAKR